MKKVIGLSMIFLTVLSAFAVFATGIQIKANSEVVPLPAGAWHPGGGVASKAGLDRIDMDLTLVGDQQLVTVSPGETVAFNYWAWVYGWGSGGYEIRQLWFVYSWASSWPPWDAYTGIYDDIPHGTKNVYGSVSVVAPTTPGKYEVWLCVESHYSLSRAVAQLKEEPAMLAHAIITVTGTPPPSPKEIATLPANGLSHPPNGGYDGDLLLYNIDVDPHTAGDQQTYVATAGEAITVPFVFTISGGAPGIIRQAIFVSSWSPTWNPPSNGHYYVAYEGIPGASPITVTGSFSLTVPSEEGEYYIWLCGDAQYNVPDALNLIGDPTLPPGPYPAHAKITVGPPLWTIKQLTKNDVDDVICTPNIAKNGKIAFDRRPSDIPYPNYGLDWDIYAMNITDECGHEKQMTDAYGEEVDAKISYDGKKMVFASGRFNPGDPWDLEIFVINVTDAPGQEIQVSNDSTFFDADPEISEDGTIVAWLSGPDTPLKHTEYIIVANINDISNVIYTTIDTPEWDQQLSMTHDGSKVCFSQYAGPQYVYVANTDGTGLTPIPGTGSKEAIPLISGDGSRIAYMWRTSLDGGDWEISVYDMLSGTTTRLTDNNAEDFLSSITADGTLVAYTRGGEIYLHNLSQEIRITNDPYEDWNPKLDEDGDTIVFHSLGRDGDDYDIFVMTRAHVRAPPPEEKFDPKVNGFGFPNPPITPKVIQSFIDILRQLHESPVTPKISQPVLSWAIHYMERDSKGLCGGMVDAAINYFEHPDRIPSGYNRLVDVPKSQVLGTIEEFQVAQFLDTHGLLKHLLLRLGDDPCGLLSLDDEVAWIKQQTDQNKPVKLIVIDPDFSFFASHAVLAYDVLEEENNLIIKLYGPNRPREEQWIELTYNGLGRLEIVNGMYPVDGFVVNRFASEDGPTSLDWDKVVEYKDTLVARLLERLKEAFARVISLTLHSPAQLHVYDPQGMHVGLTPGGEEEVEFDALYCFDCEGTQYCVIPNPLKGSYEVELLGTGNGDFTLAISSTFDGATVEEENIPGEIGQGITRSYKVDLSDDGTLTALEVTPHEIIPLWMVGVTIAIVAITTVTTTVLRRKRKRLSTKR